MEEIDQHPLLVEIWQTLHGWVVEERREPTLCEPYRSKWQEENITRLREVMPMIPEPFRKRFEDEENGDKSNFAAGASMKKAALRESISHLARRLGLGK